MEGGSLMTLTRGYSTLMLRYLAVVCVGGGEDVYTHGGSV